VVYVDNDPIVGAHAEALLTEVGHTAFVLGDVRRPDTILDHPYVASLIDFDEPVALLLVALMHFVADADDPAGLIAGLRDAMPAGSYLVLTHGTADRATGDYVAPLNEMLQEYQSTTAALNLRPYDRVLGFFDGFDLLEPGLTTVAEWRPDPGAPEPRWMGIYSGVARKN
jgi:hypothetical protein